MPRKAALEKVGKDVLGKWPGSQLYYPGKVVDFDAENNVFMVKFEETDEPVEVLAKHVAFASNAKSWRSRSSSPARSPVRVRRRSRSKSPSRARGVTRSPSRRKTNRSPKNSVVKTRQESPSGSEKESPVEKMVQEKPTEPANSSSETQKMESKTSTSSEISEEKTHIVTRRVTRSIARQQETKTVQESTPVSTQQQEESQSEAQPIVGWRGQIEAIIGIVMFPALIIGLCFVCGDKHQAFSFTKWPKMPKYCTFFDWKCFLAVGSWFDVQFLLTLLPLGEVVKGQETKDGKALDYRLNGLYLLLINVAVMGILTYTKHAFQLATLVDEYYLQIATSCLLVSFVTGIMVMIMARWDDSVTNKGFSPHNFLSGQILNPRILGMDIKVASAKAGVSLWAWLNFCFILNQYSNNKEINYPTMIVAVSQIMYIAYCWVLEKSMVRGRDIAQEKCGFALAFLLMTVTPLFYSMQTMYLSKIPPKLNELQWTLFILFQVIGWYIFVVSNFQKQQFRFDPKTAMKKGIKVIFTSNGKNLLADGWWGRLRHPNYLGDILIAISWAIPAGCCTHILPWLYPLFVILLLVYRAIEDDVHCGIKYGLSWVEYKSRVKYTIFPYVY